MLVVARLVFPKRTGLPLIYPIVDTKGMKRGGKKSEQNTVQPLRGSEFQVQDQQGFIEERDIAGGKGGESQQKNQCGKLEQ